MPKQTFFNLPEEKRAKIIDLALDEFAANAYDTASISRIVVQAGIAKGSFYQYFENKEDLYHYLLSLGMEQKAKLLGTAAPDPDMDLFAYLGWLMEMGVRYELMNPRLSQIAYRAVRHNTLPESFQAQARADAAVFFDQLVEQGKSKGQVDPEADAGVAAFILEAVFSQLGQYMMARLDIDENQLLQNGQSFFDRPEPQALFQETLRLLAHGIGRDSHTNSLAE